MLYLHLFQPIVQNKVKKKIQELKKVCTIEVNAMQS